MKIYKRSLILTLKGGICQFFQKKPLRWVGAFFNVVFQFLFVLSAVGFFVLFPFAVNASLFHHFWVNVSHVPVRRVATYSFLNTLLFTAFKCFCTSSLVFLSSHKPSSSVVVKKVKDIKLQRNVWGFDFLLSRGFD